MIQPSARRSDYRQIADDLQRRIAEGEFRPTQPLPSEEHLGQYYRRSGLTISRALDILVRRGLILKQGGAPTRVRQTPSMATVMVPGPEHPRRYVISGRGATEAEAETYGIPEGDPMLVLSEVITAPDGTVTRIEDQAWPADRFELQPPWLD